MVEETFIQKFKEILTELKKDSTVFLLAILKMDDITDRWTVVLSESSHDSKTQIDAFSKVRSLLLSKLDEQERSTIARIGVFNKNDHFVDVMVNKYRANDYIDTDEKLNGNLIHEGYVFAAQKLNAQQPSN